LRARIVAGLQARADAAGVITWAVSVNPCDRPGASGCRP